MKKLMEDKVGIVTGGATGIGRATAVLLAEEGAKVVIADYNEAESLKTVDMVRQAGGEAYFYYCDVREEEQVKAMVDFTVEKFGKLDFAFNNAGVTPKRSVDTHEIDTEDFMNVQKTNAFAVYYCMKYEAPYLLKNGGGTIVNNCSINSTCVTRRGLPYGASKFAAYAMTMCAALDYAEQNIRVNAIGPGPTLTPLLGAAATANPEKIKYLESTIPDGRMGEAIDQAKAALFLLSDMSSHITGQLILVDGGQSVKM